MSGRAISTPEKTENPASPTESSSPSHLNVTKIDLQKWSEDDQSWKKTDKGEIQIGDRLQLVLHFELSKNALSSDQPELELDLPTALQTEGQSGNLSDSDGKTIGRWKAEGSHLIVTFDPSTVEENKQTAIQGQLELPFVAQDLILDDSGQVELTFEDQSISLVVTNFNGDLEARTTAKTPDESSHTIGYETRIRSHSGTGSPITVHGDLKDNALISDMTIVKPDGQRQTIEPKSESQFDVQLDPLNPDEEYLLCYETTIPALSDTGEILAENHVSITSTSLSGKELKEETDWSEKLKVSMISGWGKTENKNADWTLRINPRHFNLSHSELNITVNGKPITPQISVEPAIEGQSLLSLPYTFPKTDQTYTLNFKTPLTDTPSQCEVHLRMANGQETTFTTTLDQVVEENPLSMSANGVQQIQGTDEVQLNWKVEVDPAKAPIDDDWTLEQTLPEGQWYTAGQISNMEQSMKSALSARGLDDDFITQVTPDDGEPYSLDASQVTGRQRYTGFKMSGLPQLSPSQSLPLSQQTTTRLDDSSSNATNETILNEKYTARAVAALDQNALSVSLSDLNSSQTGDTTHPYSEVITNGIGWRAEVTMPSGFTSPTLTISLDYPEEISPSSVILSIPGLSFRDDQIIFKLLTAPWVSISVNGQLITASKDGNNLKFELPMALVNQIVASGNPQVTIESNGQIAGYDWPPYTDGVSTGTFTTTLSVADTFTSDLGSATQTQTIVRSLQVAEPIVKTNTRTSGTNDIEYELKVNPQGRVLAADNGWITVIDRSHVVSTTPAGAIASFKLIQSSLKVYKVENGSEQPLDPSLYSFTWQVIPNSNPPAQQLAINVPDATSLVIRYQYRMIGSNVMYMTLLNQAMIDGYNPLHPRQYAFVCQSGYLRYAGNHDH